MYAPPPRQALFAIILPSCAGDAFFTNRSLQPIQR